MNYKKGVVLFFLSILSGYFYWSAFHPIGPYLGTSWLLSYERGFMKRGLVGTVFRKFVDPPITLAEIGVAVITCTALLLGLLICLLIRYWIRRRCCSEGYFCSHHTQCKIF